MSPPSPPPRLAIVDATMFWSASGGGVRRYLLAKHAAYLRDARWRHRIVAPGVRGTDFVDAGGFAIPFSGGYRMPWRRAALARLIERLCPDVIEAGDPYRIAWAALDAGQRCGVPTVAFCHSNLSTMAECWAGREGIAAAAARRLAERYLQRLYRGFDLVLAPSQSVRDDLQALGIARVMHQPLGVDTQVFDPSAHDPALRRAFGLPADARVLLYVGRFAPEKNLDLLVRTVARLGPPYVLLAMGAGPAVPRGERVQVLPFESRTSMLAAIMAGADLFVHAGDRETFGLAALEAMACGTPIVVRARGGLRELAAGGASTALDSDRPDDWAAAIAALFEGGAPRAGAAALAKARAHAWPNVLAQQQQRYEVLIGGHRVQEPPALRVADAALGR